MAAVDECRGVLRADAERNRRRILEAAGALFADAGLDVPLEDIAREAGVGIATLYRRFPTRADLAAAVLAQQLWRYGEVVDHAAAESDPWAGMSALVYGLSELQTRNAGLRELLTMSYTTTPEVQEAFGQIQQRMEELIEWIRACGVVRSDFDHGDLVLFMLGNGGAVARLEGEAAERARRRVAALFLEGIRERPDATPLPPGPQATVLRCAVAPFAT